jgi:hypothetical protein
MDKLVQLFAKSMRIKTYPNKRRRIRKKNNKNSIKCSLSLVRKRKRWIGLVRKRKRWIGVVIDH